MSLNIVIPMAGRGSRFEKAGYTFPKPLIDVDGKPMISRVIENLKPKDRKDVRFIFIVQREHYEKYDLKNVLKNAVGDLEMEVIQIDGVTEGAACTVLLGADYIDNEDELMLANSDQLVSEESIDSWFTLIRIGLPPKEEGLIMTFNSSHPKWSYAKIDDKRNVIEVAEKQVISEHATVGIYWFNRGKDFVQAAKNMIRKDVRHNGEFYVCPVYNELILEDKKIGIFTIPQENMMGLGDPESLKIYMDSLK